ncbi:25900_t:CDS:2, partial [Gigaspora margarita]
IPIMINAPWWQLVLLTKFGLKPNQNEYCPVTIAKNILEIVAQEVIKNLRTVQGKQQCMLVKGRILDNESVKW